MLLKVKNIFILVLIAACGFSSWKAYIYFFDNKAPEITLIGIKDCGHYCGSLQCAISGNKKGLISIWLDDKPLMRKFKIESTTKEYPFIIPTRTISNGKHALKMGFTDNTYQKNKSEKELTFYVDNIPPQAAFLKADSEFKVFQGRTLHIQFQVNKKIKEAKINALSNTYECFPESKNSSIYETFIPINCEEAPNEYLLVAEIKDYVGNVLNFENKFQIIKFPFKKQILKITSEKVKKEKELGHIQDQLEIQLKQLTQKSPKEKLWKGQFCTPIDIIRSTCDFGTVRTTQQKGKYIHRAVDILNEPKSVVWASQNGIVAIKDRYEESGNTVVIDHGWGITSMYFHLEDFANIKVGDRIRKGNPVGTLGKTGYATGYHLHWELRVNNVAVDPLQWVKATF